MDAGFAVALHVHLRLLCEKGILKCTVDPKAGKSKTGCRESAAPGRSAKVVQSRFCFHGRAFLFLTRIEIWWLFLRSWTTPGLVISPMTEQIKYGFYGNASFRSEILPTGVRKSTLPLCRKHKIRGSHSHPLFICNI